jgi:hypothetical protein
MACHGFALWYRQRHPAETAPAPLPAATQAMTEWAAQTEIAPEQPKQGKKTGGVDMRTKEGRALRAKMTPNG